MGSSVSTASSIVGFVSFAFTFFTFIRVTGGAIMTIFSAPAEAKDYFGNLRQELWELREDLRKASKRNRPRRGSDNKGSRSSLESGSLRVLQDTVKRIQREFRELERPFLLDPERDDPDIDSAWAHYNLRTNYCDMDISHRIRWLRSKSRIVNMAQKVSRIMVRRINVEVNNILLSMQDMERSRQQTLDQIWNMQDRLHDRSDDDGTHVRRRS
ncbi:hypothetical protein MMC17_000266 [Xylographa soralifera]|nr:hypothetical protein [Xylographa soralifera]